MLDVSSNKPKAKSTCRYYYIQTSHSPREGLHSEDNKNKAYTRTLLHRMSSEEDDNDVEEMQATPAPSTPGESEHAMDNDNDNDNDDNDDAEEEDDSHAPIEGDPAGDDEEEEAESKTADASDDDDDDDAVKTETLASPKPEADAASSETPASVAATPPKNPSSTTAATPATSGGNKSGGRKRKGMPAGLGGSRKGRAPAVSGLTIPFRTVKKAMKLDPDIPIVQNEAAIMTTLASELFLQALAQESHSNAKARGRNTIRCVLL